MIRAATRISRARWPAANVRAVLSHQQLEQDKGNGTTIGRRAPLVSVNLGRWASQQQRLYSSSQIRLSAGDNSSSTPSVDETLDKLFQDQKESTDAWFAAADVTAQQAAAIAWDPHWYNLADQAIQAVITFHDVTGAQWALSIVGVTVVLRSCLFPLMVSAQRNTSRMAHLQPELTLMKQRYEAIGTPTRQDQLQFSDRMKALFAKYEVKPFRAFMAPLVQFPLFMGMFFGLKKMPELFPDDLSTGGMLWFPDLTIPDPYYILPFASAATFLALIELGKDQMMAQNPAQAQTMLNFFRLMSVVMIPVCINFEASMLCYWTSNNILTLCQTSLLKTTAVRKYFGIWDPPKPVPGLKAESITETATKLLKKVQGEATSDEQRMKEHNQAVEMKKAAKRFGFMKRDNKSGPTGNKS